MRRTEERRGAGQADPPSPELTRERAEVLSELYVVPRAAAELLLEAVNGRDAERARRALLALEALDPCRSFPALRSRRVALELDGAARAAAELLVGGLVLEGDWRERRRIAALLQRLCREAERVARRRRREAA